MGSFSQRFKHLREKKGWTQDEVAEKLGVSRPTIAGYESEEKGRIPREETLHKIADLFGVSLDYLLGRTDDPTPVNEKDNISRKIADEPIVQFLMRSKEEMSPEAFARFTRLIEEAKKAFVDEVDSDIRKDDKTRGE